MTHAEILVVLLFAAAFAAAVRHVARHGLCSECGKGGCGGCGGCGGNCAHCHGRCPAARAADILASRRQTPRTRGKP